MTLHAARTLKHYTDVMINTLIATIVLAAVTAMDGSLPLYPHGTPGAAFRNVPANELAQGTEYEQTSSDSVQTVDQWYKANVPKACNRKHVRGVAKSGQAVDAVVYSCPGRSRIYIQKFHAGTLIGFVFP